MVPFLPLPFLLVAFFTVALFTGCLIYRFRFYRGRFYRGCFYRFRFYLLPGGYVRGVMSGHLRLHTCRVNDLNIDDDNRIIIVIIVVRDIALISSHKQRITSKFISVRGNITGG